jgi:APA family basic amino acid/polyamine antiporter
MSSQLWTRKPLKLLYEEMAGENRLRRILGPVQLTSLGVGAIIGTGIFVLVGQAAHDKTGPALMLSFVVAGLACIFAALCYAEFASMVPVAGSAYTYAYATLGELMAWIMGWDLVLEYAVGSATVAHGWSHYFQDFIGILGFKLPHVLTTAPFDYDPSVGHFVSTHTWFDLPAIMVALLVTIILVKGIRESATFNATMVIIKVTIVFFVIIVGAFYINPENWHPFAPYGLTGISFFGKTLFGQQGLGGEPLGMLAGAATIFFAYIGFDSVSTHAEEAKNPKRDVPIGIITSLVLCTILYILVAGVVTGMVPYNKINIDAPVSDAFRQAGLPWAQFLISLGALTGITSVLLVMMLSQPRVLLAMARDGLVPSSFFGAIHERFRTPWKSTILTGLFVATLAAFLPLRILAELVNIGTLLAFVIVCFAVLIMRKKHPEAERPFRVPFSPVTPILGILLCTLLMFSLPKENWYRLIIWLLLGFIIYFAYGRHHSVMSKLGAEEKK